jgi:hypothetical protein
MEIITPFEFVEMFGEGERVAVVGNGPGNLEYENGTYIDEHTHVVRFNECTTSGFESRIGKRTSILIANPYAETRSRRLLGGGSAEVVVVIFSLTRRGDRKILENWVGKHRVLCSYAPDLVGVQDSSHKAGLTTGTYGLQFIARVLRPSELFVTGFSMFAEKEHSHYWKAGIPGGIRAHDFQRETDIFVNLLNSFKCRTIVTSDVQKLIESSAVAPHGHIKAFK